MEEIMIYGPDKIKKPPNQRPDGLINTAAARFDQKIGA
jgi:hypothetical protein